MTLISKNNGAIPRTNRQNAPQPQASTSGSSSSSVSPENMNRGQQETRTLLYSELFQGSSMWSARNGNNAPAEPIRPPPGLGGLSNSEAIDLEEFVVNTRLGAIGTPRQSPKEEDGAVGYSSPSPASDETPPGFSGLNYRCGNCQMHHAISRCISCNDILCEDCVQRHVYRNLASDHMIVPLNVPQSSVPVSTMVSMASLNVGPRCPLHNESLRYVCETCFMNVCQDCTLWEHKDHHCVLAMEVVENAHGKLNAIFNYGKMGTQKIKCSIDKAVIYSQAIERETCELANRIRKTMRALCSAVEERERALLDRLEKMRYQKLTILSDQMTGLRAALAGIAQTSVELTKAQQVLPTLNQTDLALVLVRTENQMFEFSEMYKSLQPKEEVFAFIPPSFDLATEIKKQGDVQLQERRLPNGDLPEAPLQLNGGCNLLRRRPILRALEGIPPAAPPALLPPPVIEERRPEIPEIMPRELSPAFGDASTRAEFGGSLCLPGHPFPIRVRFTQGPMVSFAFEGSGDGEVSRPWGVCVDRDGQILIADRRNNRVQVFGQDGKLRFMFGSQGQANGQFDLPAGITTDQMRRIIVVDKDNHRVQIFSHTGTFMHKFGTFGRECGQFQYPWGVCVNAKGDILVSDSRNHRVQLFNQNGHFIARFNFDGIHHTRSLKGLTSPRGVTCTPAGNFIVSDFENHRLMIVDPGLTRIIATKGFEGIPRQDFSRPSGLCVDDDGRVIVADSKNQRVLVFTKDFDFLWAVDVRPEVKPDRPPMHDKDRPTDIALLPDGRLVMVVETSPESRDCVGPNQAFVHIY
ncbi:protein wech [Phlebotomus argentipes]|uniref:protein wech n=1 Tax=Phlebotomus argentipes TaxID=94469 RepID=UPI0028933985|nr:protein wech [Phlebotomus argentipes]